MPEVAVIGAGIAGIQAALDIANHGVHVHLIEKEPTIGGHMAQLDKTFPTNDCSMCILSPKMVDAARNPNITIHTLTEVTGIEGEVGAFTIRLLRHPRYVDVSECNGCGDCVEVCPVEVYNKYDAGIGVRKAIYKPHPQAVPDVTVRDAEHCIDCRLCFDICGKEAVIETKDDAEEEILLEVASVVIATGFELFDACRKAQFGYLRHPDVITSLELERMINASGPTGGKIRRISDGAVPKSVVFIQCVGSRDASIDRPYCSCVCCMYATKNAILLKEKNPELDVVILYMDMRAYGKGYEEYYNRAESLGVRYLRGMPGEVLRKGGNSMTISVEDTEAAEIVNLEPDLVVLSVGMEPATDTAKIAAAFGIETESNGFFRPKEPKLHPVESIVPGIYIAGAAQSPRDVPDSVTQGEAAAMKAFIDVVRSE